MAEPDCFANRRAALGFKRRQFARAIEEVQDARPLALLIAPGRAPPDLDHDATVITTATPAHPRLVVSQHASIVRRIGRVSLVIALDNALVAFAHLAPLRRCLTTLSRLSVHRNPHPSGRSPLTGPPPENLP